MSNTELLMREAQRLPPELLAKAVDYVRLLNREAREFRPAAPQEEAITQKAETDAEWQERVNAYLADPKWYEQDCPLCERYQEPNAETAAAIEEGHKILTGELPGHHFKTAEEFFAWLHAGVEDDAE